MSEDNLRDNQRNLEAKVSALEAIAEVNAATVEKLGSFLRESNAQIHQQIERLATQTHQEISRLAQRFNRLQRPNWQAASVIVLVIGGLGGTVLLPIRQEQAHQDERITALSALVAGGAEVTHKNSQDLAAKAAELRAIESRFRWAAEVHALRQYRSELLVQMLWNKTNPEFAMPPPPAEILGPGTGEGSFGEKN